MRTLDGPVGVVIIAGTSTETMDEETLNSLIGMSKEDAFSKIQKMGFRTRLTEEDGWGFMGTCDFRTDRVNFHVESGKVTKAYVG